MCNFDYSGLCDQHVQNQNIFKHLNLGYQKVDFKIKGMLKETTTIS